MVKVQPTTDPDGVAAAAPSDLAEVVEAPAPACTQEHESDGTIDKAPSRSLVLKGHTSNVYCLAALDGDRLASGGGGGIIVWNLADGSELAKLEGHTNDVNCLAALDGGRLASGSMDKSIIIWSVADGAQLAKLEGHTGYVWSLAALDGGRLASGSSDNSIIIWNLADGAQVATLGIPFVAYTVQAACGVRVGTVVTVHAPYWKPDVHDVMVGGDERTTKKRRKKAARTRLARVVAIPHYLYYDVMYEDGEEPQREYEVDNARVARVCGNTSGKAEGHTDSVSSLAALDGERLASGGWDKSIIIWSLADRTQLAKLEGHTGGVECLATLDDNRLASGSWDNSIIIWNLADGAQIDKLEGHTEEVTCLTTLDGGRLASGSDDKSIIIWNLADGAQIARLEGYTGEVSCLTASGSGYQTIRIRAVLHSAACKFATYGSAFEFEEAARTCREQTCLGDLFDAAAGQIGDEKVTVPGTGLPSARVTTQAHVFDAIAKVVTADEDNTALVERLLGLVRDDNLLPTMKRRGVSDAAIEKLAPTALFRVVIDAKYATGPRLLLYVEFVSFLVVMCCFARVATFDVLGWSDPWLLANKASEKTAALVVAFAVLAYFSAREVGQIKAARAIELAAADEPDELPSSLVWLVPRLLVGFMVCLPLLPVFLVYLGLACAGKEYEWMEAFGDWFKKTILDPIFHDPLTFLGLPRAWRRDYWNWIDTATLGCAWAAFARAATPGTNLSTDHAAATAMLLWLRLFGFLKNINQSLATFVLMFERIVHDLRVFMVFFLMIILAFGSAFYLYLGQHEAEYYGFHDDGAPNAFESVRMTIFSLLLLGFIGDYDLDNYPNPADRTYLVLFLVVVVIVQLNILIAIVSDSYDAAMAKSEALYYRSHLELVSETAWAAKLFPRRLLPRIDEAWIKKRLAAALEETEGGDDDQGRINYTSERTRTAVQADTRRAIADLEERMVKRMDAKLDEVLKLLRARGPAGPTGPAGADGQEEAAPPPAAPPPLRVTEAPAPDAKADGADGQDGSTLAQGPVGPTGPAGADGQDGADGGSGISPT